MKRAQSEQVNASFAQGDKITDNFLDTGSFDDGLYGVTGDHNLRFSFGEITKNKDLSGL